MAKLIDFNDAGIGSMVFGKKPANLAALAVVNENQRKTRIEQGQKNVDTEFAGFNQDFYNQRAQDYINYVLPQLGEQVRGQQKQLVYGLNARGVGHGGIANQAMSGLARQTEQQKQAIAEQGITQAQELQKQVEASRADLYNQVIQASDPAGAGRAAGQKAATYQQPSTFAPFVNAFNSGLSAYNNVKQIGDLNNVANMYGSGQTQVYTAPSSKPYSSQTINPIR